MMNYILMPSLERIAILKIATTLWNQDDIRDLLAKFHFPLFGSERREKWQQIENKVIEKVPQLSQPKSLKKKILSFIKPIGLQILKWMEYHVENFYLGINLPNELCWTPLGTVNKKKTAETLIKDENIDITRRYKLACIYCLEDDILELWKKIPENRQKSFYSEEDPRMVRHQELVILWTYDIKGEVARMDNMIEKRWQQRCSPYQYAFEYAAVGGNKAATEYFLQKLTPIEREESLVKATGYVANRRCDCARNRTDLPKEYYTEVLCSLLSQMNEEQEIEVFKSYPRKVLKCFLDWPWQDLFIKTSNHMLNFLSKEDCSYFLTEMADKVIEGHKIYDYQKLFGEFWQQCPITHKKYVIDKCVSGSLLFKLVKVDDKENLSLILKDATLAEKERIVFYRCGKNLCNDLAYNNKWNLLEYFIGECIPSLDVMLKFRERFRNRLTFVPSREGLIRERNMCNKFLQLLDDFIEKYNKKRSMEEDDSNPAKRFHNRELRSNTMYRSSMKK